MKRKWVRGVRGVALADVVVVTVAGVLIVPLLLAVVRDANQQAGVAKCLSNLRLNMRATSMYLEDYDNDFPFFVINTQGQMTTQGVCTWSHGGKTSSDYWLQLYNGLFSCVARFRPLNPYLLGGEVEPDVMQGPQIVKRTPVPPAECPADRFTYQRAFMQPELKPLISTYDDVGTSYQWNLHAISDVNWARPSGGYTDNPWDGPGTWRERGALLVRDVLDARAETFTFYIEGPMNWAHGNPTNRLLEVVGNHGEFGKHSCGYLDGHADYIYRNTRGWCGPGWEAINTRWIRRISGGQLFVPWPAHYKGIWNIPPRTQVDKNCYPPREGVLDTELNVEAYE